MFKVWFVPAMLVVSAGLIGCDRAKTQNPDPAIANPKAETPRKEQRSGKRQVIKSKPANKQSKPATSNKPPGFQIGVDSSYVLPEATFGIVIRPQQLLKSSILAENDWLSEQVDSFAGNIGFDLQTVEQLLVTGDLPSVTRSDRFPVSIVARFSKPHGGKATLESIVNQSEALDALNELEHGGTAIYHLQPVKSEDGGDQVAGISARDIFVFLPDDTTAVVTPHADVAQRLIDSRGTVKTRLTDALAKLLVDDNITMLFTIDEQLRALADGVPITINDSSLKELSNDLRQVIVQVSLAPKTRVQVLLSLVDEETSSELYDMLRQLTAQSLPIIDAQVEEAKANAQNVSQASLDSMIERQKVAHGVSFMRVESDLMINFGGLDEVDLAKLFAPVIETFQSINANR